MTIAIMVPFKVIQGAAPCFACSKKGVYSFGAAISEQHKRRLTLIFNQQRLLRNTIELSGCPKHAPQLKQLHEVLLRNDYLITKRLISKILSGK